MNFFLGRICCFILTVLLAGPSVSCKKEKSEQEMIQEMIAELGHLAEIKDVDGIMIHIADDYKDFRGRDWLGTERMIKDYFLTYKGIAVNMLGNHVDEIVEGVAAAQLEVALSSGAAKLFRKLIRYSTDIYRIKIEMVKTEGRWKICYAEWRYVGLEELLPESMRILKKLFPDMF